MTNTEIKVKFQELIPSILLGNMEKSSELAELLSEYTWSYSRLKSILVSDIKFLYDLIKPKIATDAMEFGTILHALALFQPMPEKYVFETVNKRTKAGKERVSELLKEGKTIVDPSVLLKAKQCFRALIRDKDCRNVLIQGGYREKWYDKKILGYNVGGYIDLECNFATELKTSADANPSEYVKQCVKFGYPMQAKIYQMLTGKEVVMPVVGTSEPFETVLFRPNDDFMDYGYMMLSESIDNLDRLICDLTNGVLKSYGKKTLGIPAWERKKLEAFRDENGE